MLLIGLTGSIGMGKSETARAFARRGVPVYDADAAVHALYARGGEAVPLVEAAFPGVCKDGAIDRQALSATVLNDPQALKALESIVHPLAAKAQLQALEAAAEAGASLAVLDIPLLFETGGEGRVDFVVVVSTAPELQRARVLERPGMTPQKLDSILVKQVPDAKKRCKADAVIETGLGLEHAFAQVSALVESLRDQPGTAWDTRRARDRS
ncbi:MAG TPA: dephospho-CoA kinase [Alphaproteobacteria bacterium]|nr:dephospho-CoA kinase [Alphaproteobacteria bacterium]